MVPLDDAAVLGAAFFLKLAGDFIPEVMDTRAALRRSKLCIELAKRLVSRRKRGQT